MNVKTIESKRFWFLSTVILAVALIRLINIPLHNFHPIGAMALFGAVYFREKIFAFMIPLMALFISDIVLELALGAGFYGDMIFVYGAFVLTGCIGLCIRGKINTGNVVLGALGSSVVFFLVTNFGAWLGSPLYAGNIAGLWQSYVAGLAFYQQELLGNFFLNGVISTLGYTALLFGIYALAKQNRFQLMPKNI